MKKSRTDYHRFSYYDTDSDRFLDFSLRYTQLHASDLNAQSTAPTSLIDQRSMEFNS